MYTVDNTINTTIFDTLNVTKLSRTEAYEILLISLEKHHDFPEHISPRDATLIVLDGAIVFYILGKSYHLKAEQSFKFEAEIAHSVHALENSKFLIIR